MAKLVISDSLDDLIGSCGSKICSDSGDIVLFGHALCLIYIFQFIKINQYCHL